MKKELGLGIVIILFGSLIVMFQLMFFNRLDKMIELMQKDNTVEVADTLLTDKVDVIIGDFTATKVEYGNDYKLDVVIINKANKMSSYSILIEATDANGNRIAEDLIYVNKLKSKQRQTKQAFTYVPSDMAEKLKTASFNVLLVTETEVNFYGNY